MELYLIRHGESELNREGIYYGHTDCDLTEKGVQQINDVRCKLEDIHFDCIYTSPLIRASKSAGILAQDIKQIIEDTRLMELNFGQWEGRSYKEIQVTEPERWKDFCYNDVAPPEGENQNQVYERVKDFLLDLMQESHETVAIVAHQGCLRYIVSELMNLGKQGFWHFTFTQGCYSRVQVDETQHCTLFAINA